MWFPKTSSSPHQSRWARFCRQHTGVDGHWRAGNNEHSESMAHDPNEMNHNTTQMPSLTKLEWS